MNDKRKVEIFSAGCAVCEEAVSVVKRLACSSCVVTVLDMKNPEVAERAKNLGIASVPAVVIDGRLAECCGQGIDEETLKAAGLGQPLGN
ncbi:MAG: thioredoxin family protein [Nitrospinaceae bacterium]